MESMLALDWPDWRRIFLGEQSPWFLVEILFRTTVMYAWAYVLVRTLGHRVAGQISIVELFVVIALGSSVGDPMFYEDVPLLHGMGVVTVVVLLTRGFARLAERSERFETFIEGTPRQVVREGLLDNDAIRAAQLNHEALLQMLRSQGVHSLGELRAVYLEQSGQISLYRYPAGAVRPGLAIEPPFDLIELARYSPGEEVPQAAWYACLHCGEARFLEYGAQFPDHEDGGAEWTDRVWVPASAVGRLAG